VEDLGGREGREPKGRDPSVHARSRDEAGTRRHEERSAGHDEEAEELDGEVKWDR
jgi:hypothetical protein